MNRTLVILTGAAASIAAALVYHGPLGAGAKMEADIEREVQASLQYYEMTQVQARLAEGPLRRTVVLNGPADPFQRTELVRVLNDIPGVAAVEWDAASRPVESPRS